MSNWGIFVFSGTQTRRCCLKSAYLTIYLLFKAHFYPWSKTNKMVLTENFLVSHKFIASTEGWPKNLGDRLNNKFISHHKFSPGINGMSNWGIFVFGGTQTWWCWLKSVYLVINALFQAYGYSWHKTNKMVLTENFPPI